MLRLEFCVGRLSALGMYEYSEAFQEVARGIDVGFCEAVSSNAASKEQRRTRQTGRFCSSRTSQANFVSFVWWLIYPEQASQLGPDFKKEGSFPGCSAMT